MLHTVNLTDRLPVFERRLRGRKALSPGEAPFVTGKNRGKSSNKSADRADKSSGQSKSQRKPMACYGCRVKGYKKTDRKHLKKLQSGSTNKYGAARVNLSQRSGAPLCYVPR